MSFADAMNQGKSEQEALNDIIGDVKSEFEDKRKKPKVAVKKVKAKKGEVLLSTITGGRLPTSGLDHAVKVHEKKDFASEDLVNIPALNKEYYWDADVLEAIMVAHKLGERALLQGYPGTGKSTAIEQFAHWIKQPFLCINGKDGMEIATFLGGERLKVDENGVQVTYFELGLIPRGLEGKYLICIDEVMKIPPGIQMVLQSLYQKDGYLVIDEMPGRPEDRRFSSEGSPIYLTDNVLGVGDDLSKAAASQFQDTSTLDRIGITVHVPYLPPKQEIKMLQAKCKVGLADITDLVSMANYMRKGYASDKIALTLSVRGLTCMCNAMEKSGLDIYQAFNLGYANKIGDDRERKFITNTWRTVRK